MFCEEHRKFYTTENAENFENNSQHCPSCCKTFFHSKPFFTSIGTCFTSKNVVREKTPAIHSNIRIWTTPHEKNAPGKSKKLGIGMLETVRCSSDKTNLELDAVLLGTEAVEKNGIYWTVTYEDHPAEVLLTRPRKVSSGTSTLVGLRKRKVDRSRLSKPCMEVDQGFAERYGVPKSRLNCLLVLNHYLVPNCSMAVYFGLNEGEESEASGSLDLVLHVTTSSVAVDGLRPCQPRDHLKPRRNNLLEDEKIPPQNYCPYDCKYAGWSLYLSS